VSKYLIDHDGNLHLNADLRAWTTDQLMMHANDLTSTINSPVVSDETKDFCVVDRAKIRAELQRRDEEIQASRLAHGDPEAIERDRLRRSHD
jgi:hypothetical protein